MDNDFEEPDLERLTTKMEKKFRRSPTPLRILKNLNPSIYHLQYGGESS